MRMEISTLSGFEQLGGSRPVAGQAKQKIRESLVVQNRQHIGRLLETTMSLYACQKYRQANWT